MKDRMKLETRVEGILQKFAYYTAKNEGIRLTWKWDNVESSIAKSLVMRLSTREVNDNLAISRGELEAYKTMLEIMLQRKVELGVRTIHEYEDSIERP